MQIYGPFRVSTTQPAGGVQRTGTGPGAAQHAAPPAGPKSAGPVDQLDLSSAATAAGGVNRMSGVQPTTGGDIRIDRVAELRRQIASGSYDTPEKMDAALDRFLDRYA